MGTNNLDSNSDEEIVQGIQELVRAIKLRQPKAKLYVCGILPRSWKESRITEINRMLKFRLQPDEITFIDMSATFSKADGSINSSLFSDGCHPTEEGYTRMAEALKPFVDE